MNYSEAVEFLCGLTQFGLKPGLEVTRRLAELAGHPEQKLRFIHVAGTNGKGSTCAMLESVYRASGLKVGLYTSPHLVSFGERIQINRVNLTEPETVRLVEQLRDILSRAHWEQPPTFFEVVTVMALIHFQEQGCDLVIWETGLGGVWDATNIVHPLASVITTIGHDHQKWLGHTLEEIAAQKAGIIKPGVPVITGVAQGGAAKVIERRALECRSPLRVVQNPDLDRARSLSPALRGEHQMLNAAIAIATIEELQTVLPVEPVALQTGLNTLQWPARLQEIARPVQKLILDGAHNVEGAEALRQALREHYPKLDAMIIGILEDKDWSEVCAILALAAAHIYAVPVRSPRTCAPTKVAEACASANPEARTHSCDSLAAAFSAAKEHSVVLVCGSLYLMGEALTLLQGEQPSSLSQALNEWGTGQR